LLYMCSGLLVRVWLFSFFSTSLSDWLRRVSLKWPVFVLIGIASISQFSIA